VSTRPLALAAVLLLVGCGDEELLHGLEEGQANRVLVALSEQGIRGRKAREEGGDGGWMVVVGPADAGRSRRILAERELPRPRAPGFADVFGKGSLVPTPLEERALLHHALAGELSRSIEAVDGVVEARVHLSLPAADPLRPEAARPARASVLVKVRPQARDRVEGLLPGIRALVAGTSEGLEPAAVAVLVAEAPTGPAEAAPVRSAGPWMAAAGSACTGVALGALALRSWRSRRGG